MPTSEEEGDEVVFLSPDESPPKKAPNEDQGASPQVRRSNRKRKSVSLVQDMSKGSSSKKKRSSPNKNRTEESPASKQDSVPKTTRTPPKTAEEGAAGPSGMAAMSAMLIAMEERLSNKLDANKKAVNEAVKLSQLNSDALDALEEKVDATDEILKETLARVEAQEERVLARVEEQVREMVREQLKAAGFDTQLTAADLSTVHNQTPGSYAAAASKRPNKSLRVNLDKGQRKEDKFWQCRRSLRLWPVPQANDEGLRIFLKDKLSMDDSFIDQDMGDVVIRRNVERRPKNKDEVCVEFENKQIRDRIKAQGPNLANFGDEAGMRLQIPDSLQKDFKALMAVAYDMKKRNKELKRNVKFDEETLGLFMDIQTGKDGDWKRIRPQQAYKALESRKRGTAGPKDMGEDEIESLLEAQDE